MKISKKRYVFKCLKIYNKVGQLCNSFHIINRNVWILRPELLSLGHIVPMINAKKQGKHSLQIAHEKRKKGVRCVMILIECK